MGQPDTLSRLGRAIGDAQDELLGERHADLERGRARLIGYVQKRARRRFWMPAALAAAAAVATVALVLMWRPPLTFQVGPSADVGVAGAWIAAPPAVDLPIDFSDGTEISLHASARARVVELTQHGARVVLESGAARASVVHRDGSSWRVQSGPFEVLVTGTRFDVGWDTNREVFSLTLEEGSVVVTGPALGDGRRVVTGETMRVFCREQRVETVAGKADEADPEARSGATAEPPSNRGPTVAPSAISSRAPAAALSPPASDSAAPATPTWNELAALGRYREALGAVEEKGFDAECERASARDLLTLGDVARFAGNASRSAGALRALRRRFPGSREAPTAAFVLGKIAFDQKGAYGEAATWFRTYLNEQPQGSLAREAAGRLMEALQRSGDRAGARAAAQQYLASFPGGPQAELARRLVEE